MRRELIVVSDLQIEVVYAGMHGQQLIPVSVPPGATVADAIDASGIQLQFPHEDLHELAVGIWGRVIARDHVVAEGDRVEIYRPLEMDPRDARRQRAAPGRTMRPSDGD